MVGSVRIYPSSTHLEREHRGTMSNASVVVLSGIIAMAIGCAGANRASTRRARASTCVITAEELRQFPVSSLYDALAVIRPNLLRNSPGESPVVIVDGAVSDDISLVLHILPVREIAVVRWLSAPQALQRYPLQYGHAVLEVTTVHSREPAASRPSACS
jgi:hypothetical protein